MINNKKLAELFRKKSLAERKRTKYADWTYLLHTYIPWLFLGFLYAVQGISGWNKEILNWILVISVSLFSFTSWLWWGKLQRYSKRIAKIDEKIAKEFENN